MHHDVGRACGVGPDFHADRFRILSNHTIDDYLRRNRAAAAATCSGTILVHSAVLGASRKTIDSVLLHEACHVLQFSTSGARPDARAEGEAGAASALLGRSRLPQFRYRPLRCPAFVPAIFMSEDARRYYAAYPREPDPSGSFTVDARSYMLSSVNLAGVLQQIVAIGRSNTDLLVVVHGASDGLGLPAVPGSSNSRANSALLSSLDSERSASDLVREWASSYEGRDIGAFTKMPWACSEISAIRCGAWPWGGFTSGDARSGASKIT
jgi:hypothetical protein